MDQLLNIIDFEAFALTSEKECRPKHIRLLHVFGRGNSGIFVTNDDKVYGIGHNRNGCLGLGHCRDDFRKPQLNNTLSDKHLVDIISGFEHCMAVTASGQCYSWGQNRYGQLGIGSQIPTPCPTLIEDLSDEKVVEISCGAYHSLALTFDGDLFSWGHNTFAQLGDRTYNSREIPTQVLINERIKSISSGVNHSLALSQTGLVYVWGANTTGQLGRKPECDIRNREKPMSNRPKLISGLENVVIKKAICGPNHNLILTTDGYLYAFGENICGQVGNGSTNPQFTPIKLNKQIKIKDMFSHFDNDLSIAVSEDNKFYVWGLASNRKVLKPQLIDNSFGKSLVDIYVKLAKNQIPFKAINIEDINRYKVIRSDEQIIAKEVSNEYTFNTNCTQNVNLTKDYEKVLNISLKKQTKSDKNVNQSIEEQINVFTQLTDRENLSTNKNSGKEFLKRLYLSFNNQNNCDLKIVSENKVIYCHKTVLQIRNEKFWQILSQKLSEENGNQIRINPQTYELFYAFLQYMYGIEPEIDVKIAKDLQNMAKIFCESELERLCQQLIECIPQIDLSNVCTLYEKAINESLTQLEESCVEFAVNNWKSVLTSGPFISMSDSLSKKLMISIHK